VTIRTKLVILVEIVLSRAGFLGIQRFERGYMFAPMVIVRLQPIDLITDSIYECFSFGKHPHIFGLSINDE